MPTRLKGLSLVGDCNQCGLCCFDDDGARCANLEVTARPGQPASTRCKVWDTRYDGMPILVLNGRIGACCGRSTVEGARVILARGAGKGCSLDVQLDV